MSQQMTTSRPASGTLTRIPLPSEGIASTRDPQIAQLWLEAAKREGHLVAPGQSISIMPEGAGVVCSRIQITDMSKDSPEIYEVFGSGKFGLHKGVLDEIGRSFGIDWPAELTKEEPFNESDERFNHPFCKKVTVQGRYRGFDGGYKYLMPHTKEIDLRDDAPDVLSIYHQQEKKALKDLPQNASADERRRALTFAERKAATEVVQLRKFIRAHAQTKARLQCIGSLMRRSYTKAELAKPFFVFQYIFTWKSDNPEIQMYYAKRLADQALGVTTSLYAAPQQLAGAVDPNAVRPGTIEAEPEQPAWEIPFGEAKGLKINDPEVTDEILATLENYYTMAVQANNVDSDREALDFVQAEIQRRHPELVKERGSIDQAAEQVAQSAKSNKDDSQEAPKIPFGEHKGKYFDDATVPIDQLEFVRDWAIGAITQQSGDAKLQTAALKAAVEVELKRRRIPQKEY